MTPALNWECVEVPPMWSEVSSLSWGKVNYTFVRFGGRRGSQTLRLCISSPYIRLYCSGVEPAPTPALRLRHSVQGMRRDRPRPGRNHARQLDCCRLSLVWNEEALPAHRD